MSTLSRRSMIKLGGTGLIAIWERTVPSMAAQQTTPPSPQSTKPLFLAPEDATDAAIHSKVENLFWCDAMMEHASFFVMLMPGAELATQRAQAETFQRKFQAQYDRARIATFDRTTSAGFNRSTIELMKPFIEYKQHMRDAQSSGKIRTLVFPLFFDHTAREAERAAARLEKLSSGTAALSFVEVVDFWSAAMSEHTQFIAHFLDPEEQDLIGEALDSSAIFKGFNQGNRDRKLGGGEVVLACEELIDFETSLENGISTGRIRSILPSNLADHMRRETLKFVDELKRTGSRT